MVGLAVSIAIAFVYNGPADRMARDFDAAGLGSIAPAGSEGFLIDAGANMKERPLAAIDGRMRGFDGGTIGAGDSAGLVELGYAMLSRSTDPDRVLIATGVDQRALARIAARAAHDHVRVLAGPPSLARDVLVPQPPIVARCPAFTVRHYGHGHHHHHAWIPAVVLLAAAGVLARRARPRVA
ncbi:MAG TPA: hypothetical protein VGF94_02740 [Kofleriaceae bacterium]|jgi:hypothetical protein